jgi:DNA-binding response OmpR family regulator
MPYILVAEDDPYIQLLVRRKLEGAGYEVKTTPDGAEALAMVQANPPALLLLDIMLPGRSGLDVCNEVKSALGKSAPPVIIISAKGQQNDVEAAEHVGADDYLIKPFAPSELLARVQEVMRRHVTVMGQGAPRTPLP